MNFAARQGEFGLEFGLYDFGEYRFQMGRFSLVQQVSGRGVPILSGDVALTGGSNTGGSEQEFTATEGAKAAGVSVALGVAAWALRSGGLLAAMLSSMPAWRQMDLLPIFNAGDPGKRGLERNADSEATREERAVERVLGGRSNGATGYAGREE
jgi:Na+/glutamate symporter